MELWSDIFTTYDEESGKVSPNKELFGYMMPKDDKYVDKEKTAARNLIENDLEFVPTEYYHMAMTEASTNGTFKEWYDANHVFNPYTRSMEPLKIWTTMQVSPTGSLNGEHNYIPTYENTDRTVKEEFENPNYNKYTNNYNVSSNNYSNLKTLTVKETKMLELFQSTINAYSTTHSMKKFAERGYLPRRAKYEPDGKWYISQAVGALGLEFRNTGEQRWSDDISYSKDFDANFDMMELIKQKGYKERKITLPKGSTETLEQYEQRVQDDKIENKQIDADNLALDNAVLDRDWKNVFNDFISKATEYNAKANLKNTMYILLEDLKSNPAFKESVFNRNLKRDYKVSTKETSNTDDYEKVAQKNTIDLFETWFRRIMFDQFKQTSPYSKYADLAQNITSAKYMIANVTGGIANIGTGLTNVYGEVFAKDYFGNHEFMKAQAQYTSNSVNFLAEMYKDKSSNLTVGFTKLFDVVNFDNFAERRPDENASQTVKKIRDSLYGMQSMGEHYMQNSVLFAMLKSHRIFEDTDGQTRVGSIANYNWEIEMQTMKSMLANKPDMLDNYMSFINDIKSDLNEIRKYDSFTKDFNKEFLKEMADKNLTKEYISKRDEAIKQANIQFKTFPLLEDQFEMVNGFATIKAGSELTGVMFGEFRQKVISVNKKIHGVYDKLGAASIEKRWWGSLVMQYHKHIYPGMMKRFRTKGYYNESRSSIEKGSYISLYNLLSTEFKDIKGGNPNETSVMNSIQNVLKASVDTILNLRLNYKSMPVWERNNMRRALGDLLGITSAFLLAIGIHLMTDDDDIKDSETLSTILYLADRLNSESSMYTPTGLISEAGTLWSSPLAAQNGPKDLLKALAITGRILFDEDYNPNYTTGLYKGENKLAILAYRNTPIYRVKHRLSTMTKNNNYYKINENALNIKFARAIADAINPD